MSLINDALKKAQKQRTGEAPPLASMPSVGGQSAASISRSSKPGSGNPLLVPAGIGAGVLVLVVGGYFAFRSSPSAKPVAEKPPATTATAPLPAVAQQTAGQTPGSQQGTTVPAPTFTLPVAPKPEPVVAKAETPAPNASKPAPATAPQAAVAAPSAPPAKLEPRAMTFIENIKVAGIRASATDSKVLMNDRVYRLGDVVEHEMGLKLVGITANSLTFEDEKGGRFTRTF